jgi:hypothetical protein
LSPRIGHSPRLHPAVAALDPVVGELLSVRHHAMVKRQMFGRAGLPLRKRVLLTAARR